MNTITEFYLQSEFALAAYSKTLISGMPMSDYIKALQDNGGGMSAAQAVRFASTYSVVAQWNDPNGLSATVFADAAGNTYLAIRGTNDAQDVLTDVVDIALLGTTAFQSQYASLKTKVNEWIVN